MIFSLDVRPARKGDCLLLHYGSAQEPGLIMIDGGPRGVYGPSLKPRLQRIIKARGLAENKPLQVDLLMVSHVDDDHIQGILELMDELLQAKKAHKPQFVQLLGLWHNSFDDIINHKPEELTASVKTQFGPASVGGSGELPAVEMAQVEEHFSGSDPALAPEEEREIVDSSLKVLASIEQGYRLRIDAEALDVPLNDEFDGKLILAPREDAIDLGQGGLTFKVIGPTKLEVEALRKKHNEWLKRLKEEGKSPPEALAAYVDKSVPNLSSLVLLAEADGKSILLTGDARGDKILEGLEEAGVLKPGAENKIRIGVLKVPHHGSSNNLDHDFFERIVAKHYVFSGDGEHGNPERETMEMLLTARGDGADYQIHLTYPVEDIDKERKKDWEKEQTKEMNRTKKNPKVKVRPDWSPEEHSLTAFFAANPNFAAKLVIAPEPHVINLGDPLGF